MGGWSPRPPHQGENQENWQKHGATAFPRKKKAHPSGMLMLITLWYQGSPAGFFPYATRAGRAELGTPVPDGGLNPHPALPRNRHRDQQGLTTRRRDLLDE